LHIAERSYGSPDLAKLWVSSLYADGVTPQDPVNVDAGTVNDLLVNFESSVPPVGSIPVHLSYEIIRLFSEGLYQSPQKAIEELVSNSYDAGAREVHVLLPAQSASIAAADGTDGNGEGGTALWVIDNGSGLDAKGFAQLWRVADSHKAGDAASDRPPIGQFGIGKLAAYVLAWRLTHLSKVDGVYRFTSMDFTRLSDRHQYSGADPILVDLREVSEQQAKHLLTEVQYLDPDAWTMLFGDRAAETWTAAALTDFKDLYDKLSTGRLSWVLRTGLPLHSEFKIWLNGTSLESSKSSLPILKKIDVGSLDDQAANLPGISRTEAGIAIGGISGEISGQATLYEKRLTEGKSDQYGRSNGFFIRVRGRIINLEDELFGLPALNHATWSRFSMEIDADGLREHLLSSREGVRESESIQTLRTYLHSVFNACRNAYEEHIQITDAGVDVHHLLNDAPSAFVTEPIIGSVHSVIANDRESYYFAAPNRPEDVSEDEWMAQFRDSVEHGLFAGVKFEKTGPYDRAVRYFPDSRILVINEEHPFIDKILASGRNRAGATLFGSAELLVDALLQDYGVSPSLTLELLSDRDKVLRQVAGEEPSTAGEVIRLLRSALTDETALERSVGMAFRVLGFEYERRGRNRPGPDGVLLARLGRASGEGVLADFKVVYDSKQTNGPAVPADKISLASIDQFRQDERAQFAFFLAVKYDGEQNPDSKLNKMVSAATNPVTMLRVSDLQKIVELHYRFGVTLTQLRSLFVSAHTVPEVEAWIETLEKELVELEPRVPLSVLLETLETAKLDQLETPTVTAARLMNESLRAFLPERLTASLLAVEEIVGHRWIEVDRVTREVRLHGTAGQVVAEVERNLRDLFGGVDAMERSSVSG
jgi:hypothetical protein